MTMANPSDSTARSRGNAPANVAQSVEEAGDVEQTFFYGSPCLRGYLGQLAIVVVVAWIVAALPYVLVLAGKQEILRWWFWFISAAAALLIIASWVIYKLTLKYRITSYRIDVESGFLSKSYDTLELWHVEDVQLSQSILQRVLAVGNIRIRSNDDSDPYLTMECLPYPKPLFTALKQRIISVKRQRGVLKVDGALHDDLQPGHHSS